MPVLHPYATDALSGLWQQLVTEVADRNGGVELMPWHVAVGAGSCADQRFRVRLLAVEAEGCLVVQQPAKPDQQRWLELGAALGVLLVLNNQRWLGRCRVIEAIQGYALNERTRVPAVRLAAAAEVRSSQRRGAFRADTTAMDLPPVHLWPVIAVADETAAEQAVTAKLLNVSATGMGLSVDPTDQPTRQLLKSRRYRCQFTLPAFDKPITLLVRLVHARPQPNRTVYLGLQFEFDTAGHRRQFEDRLARVTTHLEREALRQRRGA